MTHARLPAAALLVAGLLAAGVLPGPKTVWTPHATAQQAADTDRGWQDQKLAAFANASQSVNRIFRRWAPHLNAAASADAANAVRSQAMEEAEAAIQQAGLTMREYYDIAMAARGVEQLQQRIDALKQQRRHD